MVPKLSKDELVRLLEYTTLLSKFDTGTVPTDGVRPLAGRLTTYFSQFNSFACLQDCGDHFVLMFAGSNDSRDYALSLLALPERCSIESIPGRVHSGFDMTWGMLRSKCLRALAGRKSKPLVILGHSLGGAIATLCAGELVADGYTVAILYTLGSPRVGDKEYTSWSSGAYKSLRVVNGYDIVPLLPFRWFMGFSHVGEALHIGHEGSGSSTMYRNNPIPYVYSGSKDHRLIEGYLKGMKELVRSTPSDVLMRYMERHRPLSHGG